MTANEFGASASASASPCLCDETPTGPASLAWLLNLLQEAMTGLMASDTPPLQKANAVARLAGQYLKAYQITELVPANKKLVKRTAELEQRLAALEAQSPAGEPWAEERGEGQKNVQEISLTLIGDAQAPEGAQATPAASMSAIPLLVSGSALPGRAAGPLGSPLPGPP